MITSSISSVGMLVLENFEFRVSVSVAKCKMQCKIKNEMQNEIRVSVNAAAFC